MADAKQEPAPAATQSWDTQQYEEALAHLEKLQAQIDNLRSSIPSIVSPLMRPGIDNVQQFAQIRTAAVGTTTDLQAFKEDWTSEGTQALLKRSKESLQKDADLSKAAKVPVWGWGEDRNS